MWSPLPLFTATLVVLAATAAAGCGGGAIPPMRPATPAAAERVPAERPQSQIQSPRWTQLTGAAVSGAAGPDGSLYVIANAYGGPGGNTIWHDVAGTWTQLPGAAVRLAVAPDGMLWALAATGAIYTYKDGSWSTITGEASDISIGADGSVYAVSNAYGGIGGNTLWHYAGGNWTQLPGAGVRIAASWDTAGAFYVTTSEGQIFSYNPATASYTLLTGAALQVVPTASGGLFALGDDHAVNHTIWYFDLSSGQWTQEPGGAVSLTANRTTLFAISADGGIYASPLNPVATGSFPATLDAAGFPLPYTPNGTAPVPRIIGPGAARRLPNRFRERSSDATYSCGAAFPASCYHYANGFATAVGTPVNGIYAVQTYDPTISIDDGVTYVYAPTVKGGEDCLEITMHYATPYGQSVLYGNNIGAWDWCQNTGNGGSTASSTPFRTSTSRIT